VNTLKTAVLLGALTGLLLLIGNAIGGQSGMVTALVLAAVMNLGAYWFSDTLVLKMTGAQPVDPRAAPELWNLVRRVAEKSNMPMPRLYVMQAAQPNAFATGRDPEHAVVAVTAGIMDVLSPRELEGVLAHELGHVANRDTLVSAVAATLAGAVSYIAQMAYFFGGRGDDDEGGNPLVGLLALIFAPLAALLIQLAISRGREFGADRTGAETTQDPLALASALEKIDVAARGTPMRVNPSAAHLFLVNPLSGQSLAGLFSTHPPTAERVRRLRQMAGVAD
jgi:heat shock protein HtpX